MNKIKEFFKTQIGQQIYSFTKTYITVFIGIYLTLLGVVDDNSELMKNINILDLNILIISAKGALISVIRNIYKLLTEK